MLSGEEILEIAGDDLKERESRIRGLIFGLLDLGMIMFLLLPLFAERSEEAVKAVSLIALGTVSTYLKILYFAIVFLAVIAGISALALQNFEVSFWMKHRYKISLALGVVSAGVFIVTLQPYAALFSFVFLAIKAFMLIKIK